jgi:SIR2-like domain
MGEDSHMSLVREHFLDLETGICLWIGAGVTKHVAKGIGGSVPDWNGVTADLEAMAGVGTPSDAMLSNPERLEACVRTLGVSAFRQAVSRRLYGELCAAVATFAHRSRGHLGEPPDVAWQLAALGWLANPIVNFNVETITSYLVARPGGPCRILPYRIRDLSKPGVFEEQESASDFFRTVYHPHGAVNYSGEAVMTSAEYEAHNGTLAYMLSVSAAFENNLWIVGMSLDDVYLRDHLKTYRNQIDGVRWFDSEAQLKKHENWAKDARVTLVPVDWPDFWRVVGHELGGQVRRAGVLTAWSHVLQVCIRELVDGGPAHEVALKKLADLRPDVFASAGQDTADSRPTYRRVFRPDEGRLLLPDDFDVRAIEDELKAAIDGAADLVVQIQAVIAKGDGPTERDIVSALENAKPRLPAIRYMNVSRTS